MNLAKKSQLNFDGFSIPTEKLPVEMPKAQPMPVEPVNEHTPKPTPILPEDHEEIALSVDDEDFGFADDKEESDLEGVIQGEGEILVQVNDEEPDVQEFSFTLPLVPGGEDQSEIEVDSDLEVEEEDDVEVSDDPWKWTHEEFTSWLAKMMKNVPTHSGRDSTGLERAIDYLEAVDKEISRAVRSDRNGCIDIAMTETARDELHKGLERLHDRLEKIVKLKYPKRKKKADADKDALVKEGKATHVGGIIVTVPLLISSIARTCINSTVSSGKDLDDCFDELSKKYELTAREEMETIQLLADMNYPLRRPRGYFRDEEVDTSLTNNFDFAANYQG